MNFIYSRTYKFLVALPPILWVSVFLLLPYLMMFLHSFWAVRDGVIVHRWNFDNYATLFKHPLYLQVLFRTARIAASVTLLSVLLGYPVAYFLSFHAGPRKEILYQLVVVPLWVSYLVRGYAWKTILGSDGVLNGFLQYVRRSPHAHAHLHAICLSPNLRFTRTYSPSARRSLARSRRIAGQDFFTRHFAALFARSPCRSNLRIRSVSRWLSRAAPCWWTL